MTWYFTKDFWFMKKKDFWKNDLNRQRTPDIWVRAKVCSVWLVKEGTQIWFIGLIMKNRRTRSWNIEKETSLKLITQQPCWGVNTTISSITFILYRFRASWFIQPGTSRLALKWIFPIWGQMYWNLIRKSYRFVPFAAHLTHYRAKPVIPGYSL